MENKLPIPVQSQTYIAPSDNQVFSANGNKKKLNLKWVTVAIVILLLFTLPVGGYLLGKQQGEAIKTANLAKDMTSLGTTPKIPMLTSVPTPIPTLAPLASYSGILIATDSAAGKFSFSYPKEWQQPVNKEGCSPGTFDRAVYLGPDSKSVLMCQSSYGGQMFVESQDGDARSIYTLKMGFTNVNEQDATVSGVLGQRIEGVALGQSGEGALTDGTKVVHYLFYVYGRTYIASYTGRPYDVLQEFDAMVKTLKFVP
jgi:hypothetical protein